MGLITLDERVKTRIAIGQMIELMQSMEQSMARGTPMSREAQIMLGQIAQSDDINTQYASIESWLEDTQNEYRERLRQAAPDSLSCFAEFLNPDEPPAMHHEWLCQHLELIASREIMRLAVSMPPGHAKSTYCTHLFPPWYMGKFPDHKYLQAGHTQDFVDAEFGMKVRGIIDSEEFREVFPDIRLSAHSKAASRFALHDRKGKYLGRGVSQGISGFRGNIGAVDDPIAKQEDAESPTIRRKVWDWMTADFIPRLLPRSPLFLVMTRWHSEDPVGRLVELNKQGKGLPWTIINLPALAEGDNDPLGRADSEPLWPGYYDMAHMHNLRATMPAKTWNALYQGRPMDIEGGTFKSEWVKRYEKIPENEMDVMGRLRRMVVRRIVVSVDSAQKTGERNDYTAISVWVETHERKHYLVDVVRKRLEFNDLVTEIDRVTDKWNARLRGSKVNAILIEDKGSGTQYIQTQRGKARAPVIPIEVGVSSKEFRFDAVTPMFEAGEVFFPETADWLPDYESELLAFPNGSFDDQVDSTSQYLDWARSRAVGGTVKMTGTGLASAGTIDKRGPGTTKFGRQRARQGDFSGAIMHTPSGKIGG